MINNLKKIAAAAKGFIPLEKKVSLGGKKWRKSLTGFTLIETLVAVLLLTTAITGPLTIASKGLNVTLVAKDQFIAFYLAQDGMEQVRFLRDSACLGAVGGPTGCPPEAWLSSLTNCLTSVSANGCYLDSLATNPSVATACGATCPIMIYDKTNKIFNYNPITGDPNVVQTPQRFIRTITIQNSPGGTSPDEAVVTVKVEWTDLAGVTHMPVTIRENLFRWQ